MRHIAGTVCALMMSVGFIPALAHAAVGRTQGTFSVSATGTATYNIPLWTPPGPHGLQPSLSLSYNNTSPNGILGVGWSLSGISSIEACASTVAQDGALNAVNLSANASNRFCMNGNRLRLTSGTYGATASTYQTELADFSRVTAYGGSGTTPDHFIVQGKDGLIYEYGNTTDSRDTLGSSSVNRWLLNKVSDRSGNSYVVGYNNQGQNSTVVASIFWVPVSAGATSYQYKATFNYSQKSIDKDAISGYLANISFTNKNRLDSIAISYSASGSGYTNVRQYVLTYETSPATAFSRLLQIQECAATVADCLSPTVFSYQYGQIGVSNSSSAVLPTGTMWLRKLDFNGDGKSDLAFVSGGTWKVELSNGSGFDAPLETGIPATAMEFARRYIGGRDGFLYSTGGNWTYVGYNGSAFVATPTGIPAFAQGLTQAADADGDGLADIVSVSSNAASIYVLKNTSSGAATVPTFSTQATTSAGAPQGQYNYTYVQLFAPGNCYKKGYCDLNGDGGEDLGLLVSAQLGSSTYFYYYDLISGGGRYGAINAGTFQGTVTYTGLEFNDDKCTDKIVGTSLVISSCGAGSGASVTMPGTPVATMDWDGDGRADLLVPNGSTLGVYLSKGSATSPFGSLISTSIPYSAGNSYFVFDVDGDGLDDLAVVTSSGLTYYTHTGASGGFTADGYDTQTPDLLISITDGYGNVIVPSYISTAHGSSYVPGTGTQLPLIDGGVAGPIVGQVKYIDSNGSYTQTYTYKGARSNGSRQEPAGFEQVSMVDSRNGVMINTTYEQLFPNEGQIKSVDVYQTNTATKLISHTVNTLEPNNSLDSTPNNQRYFPRVASSTAQNYEVGGGKDNQLISTVASTYGYDSYGNLTSTSRTITDNDALTPTSPTANQTWTTTATTSYSPDSGTNWCLGIPTQTVVTKTSTVPGENSVSTTTNFTPDYVKCRIKQKVVVPGDSTYQVTTDYGYDDDSGNVQPDFGNLTSITVTGAGMPARTTNLTWNPTGQYAQSVTNALGQTIQVAYDLSKYVQNSQTDANGLITAWTADSFGRMTRETHPDGTYTDYSYHYCSDTPGVCPSSADLKYWIEQIDKDTSGNALHESRTIYSQLDQLRFALDQTLDGSFVYKTHREYDSLGRGVKDYVPGAGATSAYHFYTRDMLGRVTQDHLYNADGSSFSASTTDYLGLTTVFTDAQGKQTTRVKDVNGLMRVTQDANNYAQHLSYDAAGNLLQVMDSSGNQLFKVDSYDYGIKAFQRHTTDMDLGAWSYTYDALGETTSYTDAKGQSFSATYDALSRPLTRTNAEGTTTWVWGNNTANHNVGQLQSVSSPGYSEAYSYDSDSRLLNKQISGDATYNYDYTYNPTTGLPDTLSYPTSTSGYRLTLQYGYSPTGIFNQVKDYNAGTILWQANNINAFGEVTQEAYGNGTLTNKTFDPTTGWLLNQQCGFGGGACSQNESYLYDTVGNLTQRQNNNLGLTENFFYDNVYRLDHSTLNGVMNLQMGYDAMGNITSRSDIASGASWTYNASHKHQVMQAGDAAHTDGYDNNGNAVTRNGSSITWNSDNYPTQINSNNETVNLYYDANRQRYQQTYINNGQTETTMYIGGLTQKVTGNGITDYRYSIYAGNQLIAVMSRNTSGTNSLHYVLEDHQGGISKVTNSDGSSDVSESFTAFGARRNPLTWTGSPTYGDLQKINAIAREGYTDQTALGNMGLNHMNGRVEDAITGRFLSADPYITEPDNTQNYNRYSYVYNNPMSYTDPTGFWCISGSIWVVDHWEETDKWCSDNDDGTYSDPKGGGSTDTPPGSDSLPPSDHSDTYPGISGWSGSPVVGDMFAPTVNPGGGSTIGVPQYIYQQCAAAMCHGNVYQPYERGAPTAEQEETLNNLAATIISSAIAPEAILMRGLTAARGTALVTLNRAAGNAFRDKLAGQLSQAGREVETEVFKRTPFGKRYIDIEVSMDGKILGGIETKVGTSRYTPLQQLKDWWLTNIEKYPVNVARQP